MSHSVTTVIPTYNGRSLLEKYVPSLITASRNGDEILIVDDNSADETVKYFQERYQLTKTNKPDQLAAPKNYYPQPQTLDFDIYYGVIQSNSKKVRLVLIALKRNLRFGGAANIGVLLASHELVFLVNNDVQVSPDAIQALVKHFQDSQVFAVGCLEYEGTSVGEKAGKNKLWFERGMFIHSKADDFNLGPTAWASGGSAMFAKDKWLELKGFDHAYYPAYWEDVDLSYRARRKAWQVLFDPNAVVFHKHETTNTTIFGRRHIEDMSIKNANTFTWKNGTLLQKLQYLVWKPYWQLKRS